MLFACLSGVYKLGFSIDWNACFYIRIVIPSKSTAFLEVNKNKK